MTTVFCNECHKMVATVIKTDDKIVVMQQGKPTFTTKPGSRISVGGYPPGTMPVKCPDGHLNKIRLGGEVMVDGKPDMPGMPDMAAKRQEMEARMKVQRREMTLKRIEMEEKMRDATLARVKEMDERIYKLKAELE